MPLAEELEPPADTVPCSLLAEVLSAYVDGELAPRRGREIERHLVACGECRARVEALLILKQRLGTVRTPSAAPEGFWDDVCRRLDGRCSRN